MNEISVIINGVRYDAIMQNDFSKDCIDCVFLNPVLKMTLAATFLGIWKV